MYDAKSLPAREKSRPERARTRHRTTLVYLCLPLVAAAATTAQAADYAITVIDEGEHVARDPVISDVGMVAWSTTMRDPDGVVKSDILIYLDGKTRNLTKGRVDEQSENIKPYVCGKHLAWVSSWADTRDGSVSWELRNEVCFWEDGNGPPLRISYDARNDLAASVGSTGIVAYQKARGYPFGWEIMVWEAGQQFQLTTNFYYDMGPRVYEKSVVWYGWDGEDYEIFLYDHEAKTIEQITDNYFDDVSPEIWGATITWEGYPSAESDIYMWTRPDGNVRKITDNPEDDINSRIWKDIIVWQSFDADDFEIWLYEISTATSRKLTNNGYDDVQPHLRDGVITWMGYDENRDAEVFVGDLVNGIDRVEPVMLTDNEHEDRDPQTAGGRVVWLVDEVEKTRVLLAEPR